MRLNHQAKPDESVKSSKRVLEPYDRVSEVLFGLIMVLTFTGSLSVANTGREDVNVMLIGALGCNIAWGIIDGVLYLMGCLAEKGTGLRALRAVRNTTDPTKAREIIAASIPSVIAAVMKPDEFEAIHRRIAGLPEPPERSRIRKGDWLGAVGVFGLVVLSTFPVAIPFLFIEKVAFAMRVSNGIAIVMLFATGYAFGRIIGRNPLRIGLAMVALGALLVLLTIALGG